MHSNPLTWGLGSFQTCSITPFVREFESSSTEKDKTFSNGKLLTFGFRITPSNETCVSTFYDDFIDNLNHLVLSYQLVDEENGILLSKAKHSAIESNNDRDNLQVNRAGDALLITVSSTLKVSPMHLQKSLILMITLEFYVVQMPIKSSCRMNASHNYVSYQVSSYTLFSYICPDFLFSILIKI
jgi:hypothetical protein